MDEHGEQPIQPEPQEVTPEVEYFTSPLDLTPEELQQEKQAIDGKLGEPERAGHYRSSLMDSRFAVKLLTDPATFDSNFTLNEDEQKFIRKNVLEWGHGSINNIEAMPSLRDEIDLSEEAFRSRLERLVGNADNTTPYHMSELCVLFENKYKVPEGVWEHFTNESEKTDISYASQLKLIDPERFMRDGIASRVDLTQAGGQQQDLRTRAAIKIIQADGIKYDRTHGMQLVTAKKAA